MANEIPNTSMKVEGVLLLFSIAEWSPCTRTTCNAITQKLTRWHRKRHLHGNGNVEVQAVVAGGHMHRFEQHRPCIF